MPELPVPALPNGGKAIFRGRGIAVLELFDSLEDPTADEFFADAKFVLFCRYGIESLAVHGCVAHLSFRV